MTAAKKPAARASSAKKRPPVEVKMLPKPEALGEAEKKSPYPEGIQVYSYQPKGGGEPILLPLNGFDRPSKLWHFDIAQLPLLAQTWRWMEWVKVPKVIQRQAQVLPDPEYFAMFDEWFDVLRKLSGHGPRGAVTAGK